MDWEEQSQIALFNWFKLQYGGYANYWHHSPNGGLRNLQVAKKLKAMGTQKGFPDICIFLPTKLYSFLALELKTDGREGPKAKRGRLSADQQLWQPVLARCGAHAVVAYGFVEAQLMIKYHMEEALKFSEADNGIKGYSRSNGSVGSGSTTGHR